MNPIENTQSGELDVSSPAQAVSLESDWSNLSNLVDVNGWRISGSASSPHNFEHHNYIRCVFDDVLLEKFHMKHMDFKDCSFVETEIVSGMLESNAMVNCVFNKVKFHNEHFRNNTFQDCRFYDCEFTNVDLENAFIKGCRFSESTFSNCDTSNHVFEECMFHNVRFEGCELQSDVITKNYGLKATQFLDVDFRDKRKREGGVVKSLDEIVDELKAKSDPIGNLRLDYFLNGDFLSGSDALDQCLNEASWLKGQHNDFTVGDLISQFGEFIVSLWDKNELTAHALLMVHRLTGQLSENARQHSDEPEYYRASLNMMGTHMMMSRKVEEYHFALSNLQRQFSNGYYQVVVDGPANIEFYEQNYAVLFSLPDVHLQNAKPYNSSILTISGLTFLAWFLGSLEKMKLQVYATDPKDGQTSSGKAKKSQLVIGYEKDNLLEVRVATIIPRTSVIADFEMAVSTKFVGKLRQLIVTLIDDQKEPDKKSRMTEQE